MSGRIARTSLSLLAGALLLVGLFALVNPSSAAPRHGTVVPPASEPLTGVALAESLGLELLPEKPADCMDYVEVDNPAGYCIQEVVTPGSRESYELGQLLRGYIPTDLDLDIFDLSAQIAETPSDDPSAIDLYARLKELLAQRDAATT